MAPKLTRRKFCDRGARGAIMLAVLSLSARREGAQGQGTAKEKVKFRLRVPAAHYEAVHDILQFEGKIEPERDTKGLPLSFIFVGLSLLPSLADAILTLRQRLVQPGIKIDTRGDEIRIDVAPDLPRGTI